MVTCMPDVIVEKNGVNKYDYILIGSDGIFDKLKNENINKTVWEITTFQRTQHQMNNEKKLEGRKSSQPNNIKPVHSISGLVADEILQAAAANNSLDNISVVFIAFKKFE